MSRQLMTPAALPGLITLLALISCTENPNDPDPPGSGDVEIVAAEITDALDSPMYLTSPTGDDRLFVVEQGGAIRIIEDGQLLPAPFLDIDPLVASGGERGLLSMAFHPDYDTNGYFYLNYTDNGGDTRIERYRVSNADPNLADPGSAQLVLTVEQPESNHNGGLVKFGPDGMLYIGMGDGGGGGDPLDHGQNPNTLLGALLRINVDGGTPYSIPANNPWANGSGGRQEIWAIGLRNPWRFSFDREGGMLYLADVGQNRREEINVVSSTTPGLNFGWDIMEGTACYEPMSGCSTSGLVLPVHEYSHATAECSVTGGYVYRGSAIPELDGHYFYADFCAGFVRSFVMVGGDATEHQEWDLGSLGNITSFGEDADGELYILVQEGSVYRISPAD
jgi:glucose/arabinose dehydrogenase